MTYNTAKTLLVAIRDGKLDELIEAVAAKIFNEEELPTLKARGIAPNVRFFPEHRVRADKTVRDMFVTLLLPGVLALYQKEMGGNYED